jgi:hypothetical protein
MGLPVFCCSLGWVSKHNTNIIPTTFTDILRPFNSRFLSSGFKRTAACVKMRAFWDTEQCNLKVDKTFQRQCAPL